MEQNKAIQRLLAELQKLHHKKLQADQLPPDYFEPDMEEFPGQYEGLYEADTGEILLRFCAKGTRYEGRSEWIEKLNQGDTLQLLRDRENSFNPNNFAILTARGRNIGNMPAELCHAIAPLYDNQELLLRDVKASFVVPISRRSRYARQAIVFVELRGQLVSAP